MWKLTNAELETETYERKYALNLYKLSSKKFPLALLNSSIVTSSTSTNILLTPTDSLIKDTNTINPVGQSYFYLVEDLILDLSSNLTEVPDNDLIITDNSYYCNYGNINPFTLVHTSLDLSLFLQSQYTFEFIVPTRNSNYEYLIDLSNFPYPPNTITSILASGIRFNDIAASEGCPNYFVFDSVNQIITLKGCSSCKPVTGDTATVSGTLDLDTTFTRYTAYKFIFSSDVAMVSSLSYLGDTYTATTEIVDKALLFSSELSACICLTL
jgi:hypothetical protein